MDKLDKDVVLYFTAKEIGDSVGARCGTCRHFMKDGACTEVVGDINGDNGICGLFAYGTHEGVKKTPNISKKDVGYAENGPTHCGNCIFYGGGENENGPCERVKGTVEFEGCCNAWQEGKEEEKQINRENIRPSDEAGYLPKKKRKPGQPIDTEGERGVEYALKEEQEFEAKVKRRKVEDPVNVEDETGGGSGVEKSYDPNKRRSDATLGEWVEVQQARPPRVFRQNLTKYLNTDYPDINLLRQSNPPYRTNLIRFALARLFTAGEIEKEANYESWGSEEPIPVERCQVNTGTEVFDGLVCGSYFLSLGCNKAVLSMLPGFQGSSHLDIYSTDKQVAADLLNKINQFVKDNNYMKGSKLLSNGQFLNVPKMTWDDVILTPEIEKLLKTHVLDYIANIEELKKLGLPTKRGLLIVGPQGNGKTCIGKALAYNSPSTFIWVPAASDYHHVYTMARELAPTIVFIEDIAAHGGLDRRAGPVDSDTAELLNMLDGVEQNELILTVATENNPDLLDPALRNRPGRFDVIVPLPNPGVEQRERVLQHYLANTPLELIKYMADQTGGYSCAHLRELATRIILEGADTVEKAQAVINGITDTFGALAGDDTNKDLNEASVAALYRERQIDRGPSHKKTKYRRPSGGVNPPSDPGDPTGKSDAEIEEANSPDDSVDVDQVTQTRRKKRDSKNKPGSGVNPVSSPPPITVNVGSGVANLSDEPDHTTI